ncbi:MAG TPA: GNAT family N-acetyltransferase [Candidatus Saccharimonadales bacterium]|nr:GNAT family N-acetyltransferase [Candidatus Saccharimonadales bacterium]
MITIEVPASNEHHENPYELSSEELLELTSRLLAERPPQGDDRFVCYKLDGQEAFANIGRKIEAEVFGDAFKNTPEDMQREYGPYEPQSMFFVSIDRENNTPTGVMRVIKNGPQGFKSIDDFLAKHPNTSLDEIRKFHGMENDEKTWDIGTVAVLPEYRDKGAATQLYRAMYRTAVDDGIEHVVAIIDADPLAKMNKYLGIPLVSMMNSDPFSYIGSEKSQAVYGHIPEFDRKMMRHKRTSIKGVLARKAIMRLLGRSETSDRGLQF